MTYALQQLSWKSSINAYLPPIVWAIVIYLLSNQAVLPGFTVSLYDFVLKKIAHIVVYGVLFLLLHRSMLLTFDTDQLPLYSARYFLLPILICLLYAISDEIHQSFIPGRYGTLRDIGYDMLGVFIAFLKRYDYI